MNPMEDCRRLMIHLRNSSKALNYVNTTCNMVCDMVSITKHIFWSYSDNTCFGCPPSKASKLFRSYYSLMTSPPHDRAWHGVG